MGRMLDTLKQAETPRQTPRLAPLPTNGVVVDEPAAPEAEVAETEIPFIEWGPRKSMEASPSVLAVPVPRAVRPQVKDETAVALVAAPHSVLFRAMPSAKPAMRFAPELVAFHDPINPLSVQYRELLLGMLEGHPPEQPRALLFTTTPAGEGATTVLLNTAISAARLGRRRIAVLDANLEKPTVASALGLAERPGVREVLAGAASLDEALQATAQDDLTGLSAGLIQPSGGIRFLAATMRSLLRQMRERFDVIFINAAAWESQTETMNLAPLCEAVYLVLSSKEADTSEVDELLCRMPAEGAKLAGCIVFG